MKIIEIFDGGVTLREYDGYFYSVGQAIVIVILGLMSGLKNGTGNNQDTVLLLADGFGTNNRA